MHRIAKLLGMIFIFGMVFFIICDEKGYKFQLNDNNHIVINKLEKKSEPVNEENLVYKNSDLIHLNYEFKNPKKLHKSNGLDPKYLAKLEQEKKELDEQRRRQVYTGPNIISVDNKNSISSFFQNDNGGDSEKKISIESLGKYELKNHKINLGKLVKIVENNIENGSGVAKYRPNKHYISLNKGREIVKISGYTLSKHFLHLKLGKKAPKVHIVKYVLNSHRLNLKPGIAIEHEFIVEDTSYQQSENLISDETLENLIMNDDIDVDALESENDEFLQKVFEKTKDTDVMNLIIETYLNEYQFVKAKKFIEELPQMYLDNLKPSLNLRVVFNSFSLSSNTTNETLTSLIENYLSKHQISDEDGYWYLGVLSLMERDYDNFFNIANYFKLENHIAFATKIQLYKDQISKQMGMPEYYFDTLVALELFNQGFFQPAKVLALYSLQQNSNYILPYQILAYANFLTNSWDTSIEYLKKLVDLDPSNAEKYQFLMGVAYYWNQKHEQSVIMLSLIQSEKLRLDSERYLIRDYLFLNQNNKLIASRNKLLGYDNLVASDFYTYFYETFYHPYSEGSQYQLYAIDTDLADKMIRVCAIRLPKEDNAVCNYGSIGKNIALGKFDGLEQSLLKLATEYPQGYLYHALGEYYLKQNDLEKARIYLLKATSLTQKGIEKAQIKKLLQDAL